MPLFILKLRKEKKMKRHLGQIICRCLILWCITGLLASHVFADGKIESVVCNPNTGRISVKYKNTSGYNRAGEIFAEVYNKDTGKYEWHSKDYVGLGPYGVETQGLDTPPGAVVRQVRIYDTGGGGPFQEDVCKDTGDPRWSYVYYDLLSDSHPEPTVTEWGLIIMAGLLLP